MEPGKTSEQRTAREIEGAQRRSGKSWGGNGPRQWLLLGLFAAAMVVIAGTLALVA